MLISNIQLSYLKNGAWNSFTNQTQNAMDGIKIQTPASSPFYLQYRTWNEGKTAFYSYVKSNVNDYAGSNGRPIQRLQIQVYKNDGTKLTSNIVVMYRAHVENRWLPWVSNADPEWMQSVFEKYRLEGTMSTSSYYAGNAGQNINGIEILVYEEADLEDNPEFTGGEVAASLSYMVGDLSNWTSFNQGTYASQMDGIKIQTDANKNYHLSYKTWNEGNSSYYSEVSSTGTAYNDYAGLPGKPIQRLSIQAYKNDGTKLTSGVIVMYRAYVEGRWLPWVSNATPDWMRNIQNKYNLGGTLNTSSGYAGNAGENISGVEVRIFEEDSSNAGSDDFAGSEINLSLSYITDNLSNWTSFNKSVSASGISGVKIQTESTQPFYLMYKTLNQGRSVYYPEVKSTGTAYNDYAGYPGKNIQLLSIGAYNNDGTKLKSGVVVMYRVSIAGRWLPWVSNADPEWMQSVKRQYNLDGTLDTKSTYAGNSGQNIDGIEIRAFTGNTNYHPIEDLPGTEAGITLSYMKDSLSNWTSFTSSVQTSPIDGIKIQTASNKGYYLSYKSWNSGKTSYYPEVKSTGTAYNDYAGYPGKPMQLLSIHAYRNDGVKLKTGVVVMYRVHVDNRWLPWVSNADPEWMRSVHSKYNLGGILDTRSSYAGNKGQNINGVEIRIFEENSINDTPQTPVGNYKIINVPFIPQFPKYPNGCESVSAVMALNYIGVNMSVDTFIDNYLEHGYFPFDPNISFGNDPRDANGYGCYTPVIKKALDEILVGKSYTTKEFKGKSLTSLCSEYIDNNIPVIICATQHMEKWYYNGSWYYNGKKIQWISPMHCLLLVGYDDNHYIFNDPQETKALTYYSKESVEDAYNGLFQQAIVLIEKEIQEPPTPVYKYGAVKNPVTGEIYPIRVPENNLDGHDEIKPNYIREVNPDEKKPTNMNKTSFNLAQFVAGLEFDNSFQDASNHPVIGGLSGILIGGITSFVGSWSSIYMDVNYYKLPSNGGDEHAVISCGASQYNQFFSNWDYVLQPKSLKSVHGFFSGDWDPSWAEEVDDFAKEQYLLYKDITRPTNIPYDSYKYDIEYSFAANRKDNPYVSYIFLGKDRKMYEYAKIYAGEKIEIVVTDGNGSSKREIDRLNIISLLSPVSELPADKAALFNIEIQP